MKKIFIVCSKAFYYLIPSIKESLEAMGFDVYLPNCYDNPGCENEFRNMGEKDHIDFKQKMFRQSEENIKSMDALLVLNFGKYIDDNVWSENYIGGATLLEIYDAWRHNKEIYLYNGLPEHFDADEVKGLNPTYINQNLSLIRRQ